MADIKQEWDVIVVGGGVMGLWTAYSMVKEGLQVLLIDQFQLPNKRGSSGGATRFIRFFSEHSYFMPILKDAYQRWRDLEKVSGEQLLQEMGSLQIHEGAKSKEHMRLIAGIMRKFGLPHDVLTSSEMKQRFPMFNLSDDAEGVYDPSGTCLFAVRCNRVLLSEFLRFGGRLSDNEKLLKVIPGDTVQAVITSQGRYQSRKVVLATGTWSDKLFTDLGLDFPLSILPAAPCYWKEKVTGSHSNSAGMPIFAQHFEKDGKSQFIYGIPSIEYPGMVKVATRGDVGSTKTDPDERDCDRNRRELDINELKQYISQRLPGLESSEPAIVEDCVYTITPDMNYIVDTHPQYPNILIGTGGTCHGYRGAPVIGKLLTELAMGKTPSHDISPFRVTRFKQSAKL